MNERARKAYLLGISAILALGVVLRTVEYAALGSLWIDELFIALNVTTREWRELLVGPLAYRQVAPIGFLVALKLGTEILGMNEAGLRLFPYLLSIAGLFLFWRVSTRFLPPLARAGAVAIFALSPTLLWYSRNAKQYSSDVAIVLLLVLLALRFREGRDDSRSAVLAGLVGGLAILCSQPAMLVAVVLSVVLIVQRLRSKRPMRPLIYMLSGWMVGSTVLIATSLILSPPRTREFMRAGWSERGFIPYAPRAGPWLPHRLLLLIGLFIGRFAADSPTEYAVAGAFGAFAIVGVWWLVKNDLGATAVMFGPLFAAVLASAARVLPLSGRVSLYIGPILLIASMAGIEQIRDWLPRKLKAIPNLAIFGLAAVPATILLFVIPVPERREEARPVLEELRSRWRPGDEIFVLPSGGRAMEFYGAPLGLKWQAGRSDNRQPRASLKELDGLRGEPRAWIFFTHTVECQQEFVRSYLETVGREIDRIEDPYGETGKKQAAAYLYDLSDGERLARSSSARYPAPAFIPENCRARNWNRSNGSRVEAGR